MAEIPRETLRPEGWEEAPIDYSAEKAAKQTNRELAVVSRLASIDRSMRDLQQRVATAATRLELLLLGLLLLNAAALLLQFWLASA